MFINAIYGTHSLLWEYPQAFTLITKQAGNTFKTVETDYIMHSKV